MYNPIPVRDLPDYDCIPDDFEDCGEKLVSLQNLGIICEPYYKNCGFKYALDDCLVRESVADKIVMAVDSLLPYNLTLRVWDGYRPFAVQQTLWEMCRLFIKHENPGFSDFDTDTFAEMFIEKPRVNIDDPFLHNTGGAVDLTLCYRDGSPLELGCYYNDFTQKAYSHYYESIAFEHCDFNGVAQHNRRVLYNTMIAVGFTGLPTEWWHFDYGNMNWAFYTGNSPLYKGILDNEEN